MVHNIDNTRPRHPFVLIGLLLFVHGDSGSHCSFLSIFSVPFFVFYFIFPNQRHK